MKNENKLPDNIIIHCGTEEITKEVLKRFHNLGCVWEDGSSCLKGESYWKIYMDETCFIHFRGRISYMGLHRLRGCALMSGKDFLNKYPVTSNILKLSKLNKIKLKFTL